MDGEKKKFRFSIGYLILAFWAVLLVQQVFSAYMQPNRVSYTDFKAAVAADRVEDVAIGQTVVRGHFKEAGGSGAGAGAPSQPAVPHPATSPDSAASRGFEVV